MIVFGTDGWRGVIARDYTFDNLNLVATATANYVLTMQRENASVVIGYDTRFMSREFAEETARIFASKNITVHLTQSCSSTPQVSFHTKQKGACLGIVITASHNPPIYNGFKVKASFGGPAYPEQISQIEAQLAKLGDKPPKHQLKTLDEYLEARTIRQFDAKESYLRYIRKKIDLELIQSAGLKIAYDPMHGAGIDTIHHILPDVKEIHGEYNPSFGEVHHPEPIHQNLRQLIEFVRDGKYDLGLATDGDADRLGAVDEDGNFVDSHRIFMLLMKYLYEDKKKRGTVVKTVSLTSMVAKYCEKNGIKVIETPVGFKYTAKLMNESKVLIGGEESGGLGTCVHIPERDGIFNGLLLLEMIATRKKTLKQLCDDLDKEFGIHRYARRDVTVTESQKKAILKACEKQPKKIGRFDVIETNLLDGYKFIFENGWLLIRASGTEPLIRFYAESDSLGKVNELLEEAIKLK